MNKMSNIINTTIRRNEIINFIIINIYFSTINLPEKEINWESSIVKALSKNDEVL